MVSAAWPQATGELDGDQGGERVAAATPFDHQWVVDTATGRVVRRRRPARPAAPAAEPTAEASNDVR